MSKFNLMADNAVEIRKRAKRVLTPKSEWKSKNWTLQFPANARIKAITYIEWERGDGAHWRVTPIDAVYPKQHADFHADKAFRPIAGDRLYPSYGNYLRHSVFFVDHITEDLIIVLRRSRLVNS